MVIRAILAGIFVNHVLSHMYTFSCRSDSSVTQGSLGRFPNCQSSCDVVIFFTDPVTNFPGWGVEVWAGGNSP